MTTGGPFQIFIFNKEKKRVLHAVYPPHVCFSFSHISLPSSARSAGRHLNFEWGLGGGLTSERRRHLSVERSGRILPQIFF